MHEEESEEITLASWKIYLINAFVYTVFFGIPLAILFLTDWFEQMLDTMNHIIPNVLNDNGTSDSTASDGLMGDRNMSDVMATFSVVFLAYSIYLRYTRPLLQDKGAAKEAKAA